MILLLIITIIIKLLYLPDFILNKPNRLSNFIKEKAQSNYSDYSYWVIDNTAADDNESSFGKDLLIHLNKDFSNDSLTDRNNTNNDDYTAMMSMIHFTDQNLEINESSPGPSVITMENLRRSSRLNTIQRSSNHDFNVAQTNELKGKHNQGTELIYEVFKDIVNARATAVDKTDFINQIDYIFRDILQSYSLESYSLGNINTDNTQGRNLGRSYPKTVDGRNSLWSRGGGVEYAASNTSRQYVCLNKVGEYFRPDLGDSCNTCEIWINGKKYSDKNQSSNDISPENLNTTDGGKIIIAFKDKGQYNGKRLPPPNGINILGFAEGEKENSNNNRSYSNGVPKINNTNGDFKTPNGLGLNYLIMYDEAHTDIQIENNLKYLNKQYKVYNANSWEYDSNASIPNSANKPSLPGDVLFKYKSDASSISEPSNIQSTINNFNLTQTNNSNGFDKSVFTYKLTVPYSIKKLEKSHLNVTLVDSSTQPDFELTHNIELTPEQETPVILSTYSESRMNVVTYTINVTRQTSVVFATNKVSNAYSDNADQVNTEINNICNNAIIDTDGRLNVSNTEKQTLKDLFVLGGGDPLEKHRKLQSASTLLLTNFKSNNSKFNKDKGLKLSKDTFDTNFTDKLKNNITDVIVYPVDAKPDFTNNISEGAYIPFSDGETFTFTINSLDISVECITSIENSTTGNYTISLPSKNNVSRIGGGLY